MEERRERREARMLDMVVWVCGLGCGLGEGVVVGGVGLRDVRSVLEAEAVSRVRRRSQERRANKVNRALRFSTY